MPLVSTQQIPLLLTIYNLSVNSIGVTSVYSFWQNGILLPFPANCLSVLLSKRHMLLLKMFTKSPYLLIYHIFTFNVKYSSTLESVQTQWDVFECINNWLK